MLPRALAFLNIGGGEFLLLALLAFALFGVDRLPEMARTLGKVRAEVARTTDSVAREIETAEERAFREQVAFERAREAQIAGVVLPDAAEEASLSEAAEALGIDPRGKSPEEVRRAIAAHVAQSGRDEAKP